MTTAAEGKVETSAVIEHLAEQIGDSIEKRRKTADPIPAVYSSGMRGNEKPPNQREKPKAKKTDEDGEERFTKDGKKVVTFKAAPRRKVAEVLAERDQTIADLTKRLEKLERKKK